MKRTLVGLSVLTLALISNPALAQDMAAVNRSSIGNNLELTPFNLVNRSYRGSFSNVGIPSYGAFTAAIQLRRITAEDLVEKAMRGGLGGLPAARSADRRQTTGTHLRPQPSHQESDRLW